MNDYATAKASAISYLADHQNAPLIHKEPCTSGTPAPIAIVSVADPLRDSPRTYRPAYRCSNCYEIMEIRE